MRLSDINSISALKSVLLAAGVIETIYEGSKPTSDLPTSYISIMENGSYKSRVSQMGIIDGGLILSIYVKLLSTGATNKTKESLILKQFDALFEDSKTIIIGKYHISLDVDNLVYSGRGISSGYSTRIINLLVKIY